MKLEMKVKRYILCMCLALTAVAGYGQKTDRDYLRSGNKLYKDSLFVKAEVDYRKALELNPNEETVTDVTGVTATTLDKNEEQTSGEPYYAKRESKLFAWLYSVVRVKKTLTDVEKTFCCVNIFAESEGKYDAWTQKAIVAVQSYGGSTKGLQLPYNIHWIGERTYGAAAITAGKLTFTPGSSALE